MREILIRDLAKFINCDTCVHACAARHGTARMTMEGPRFGRYQLPDVCRNCEDTPCVTACHLDGMKLHNGKTFVSDACRGCNKCVEACRYGVVKLLPRQHTERQGFFQNVLSKARTTNPPKLAPSRTVPVPVIFKHSYPLDGAHANIGCERCHATGVYAGTPRDCIACHRDIHKPTLGRDCAACHTTKAWKPAKKN